MRITVTDEEGLYEIFIVCESLWVPLHTLLLWAETQQSMIGRRADMAQTRRQPPTAAQQVARQAHTQKKKAYTQRAPTYESPKPGTLGALARTTKKMRKKKKVGS